MRVMILIKANQDTEADVVPDTKLLAEMGKFNEELVKEGIMLAGDGLHSSAQGKRIKFNGDQRTEFDGPFSETKQLVAGFWIWRVKSIEEAVEWVKRCPNPTGIESEIEIRPIFENEEFGDALTPELQEQDSRLREGIARENQKAFQVNPYLNFNGKSEEAFTFYKSIFGGEFTSLQRFKDMPKLDQGMPENERNRIMHIALPIGKDTILMGSDISESMGQKLEIGNNINISLHPKSKEEAERLYKGLSTGGKIEMKLEKMFWGAYFASFTDKFGIRWMINYEEKK